MRSFFLFLVSVLLVASCTPTQQTQKTETQNADDKHQESEWKPAESPLETRWAKDVSPDNVLPEYPRPQMKREEWKNLNGLWQYRVGDEKKNPTDSEEMDGEILVPFAIESALSGVKKRAENLQYRRRFTIPEDWEKDRVLLHFGAVDWQSEVYVNGQQVGSHKGGYDSFSFDITEYLETGENEIVVDVYDPTDDGDQPRGKQVKDPQGIWYTPVTGIWQTVWMEPVSQNHISDLKLTPDIDKEELNIQAETDGEGADEIRVTGYDGEEKISSTTGQIGEEFSLSVSDPTLWTPDNPHLYDLKVELLSDGEVVDEVDSYFGMRKVEIKKDDDGKAKIFLNDEFTFQLGPLDQGYWPDGLYTAPTDEALRYDLEMTKRLGFNMNRKHVKIEPDRWYYWADKLGVLVWQDMVTGSNTTSESQEQYEHELKEMVDQFYNHPSIVNWIIFNEGWGQFDTERITEDIENMDESRIITDASGWQHYKGGDVIDIHRYPGPAALKPTSDRAALVGEFGGVGYIINDHIWGGDGWGYQDIIRKPEAYADRYEELLHKLRFMGEEYGMSGGVYTQLTDLETELNGLLTYDREVAKAAPQQFASVNEGVTPYIHPDNDDFMEDVEVEIHNWADNTEIRYTLDGSDPDTTSTLYDGSFMVDESTTVRARSFQKGVPVGYESSSNFDKISGKEPDADNSGELEQGLAYKYYENAPEDEPRYRKHWPLRGLAGSVNTDLKPKEKGTTENFDLDLRERDELFAFVYEGWLEIPEDGVYTFHIGADDDAKIYLGDKQIFDRLGQSPATSYESQRVALQKGFHKIEIRYFQAYGPFELNILWEGPGINKQRIPSKNLYLLE